MSSIVNFQCSHKTFPKKISLGYLDFVSSFQCHANWHLPLGHVQQLLKLTRMMSKPKKGAPFQLTRVMWPYIPGLKLHPPEGPVVPLESIRCMKGCLLFIFAFDIGVFFSKLHQKYERLPTCGGTHRQPSCSQ